MTVGVMIAISVGTAVACSGHDAGPTRPAVTLEVSAAQLGALPQLQVNDGRLLCQADGVGPCPVGPATANWGQGNQIVIWEPRRLVQVWTFGKTDPTPLGEVGTGENQYSGVISVGPTGAGYTVIDAAGAHAIRFNQRGQVEGSLPIPSITATRAIGFAGKVGVLQTVSSNPPGSPARFQIRETESPGDTVGKVVLDMTLPWLRLNQGHPTTALPLFPSLPSYSIASNGDLIWSPGDSFVVHRVSPTGTQRWTLHSDLTGPAITDSEISAFRAQYASNTDPRAHAALDSAIAHTGKNHPAVGGLIVGPDDRVMLAGGQTSQQDTVSFYLLDQSGKPTGKFVLPRSTHVMLFAGDSLLVQRQGAQMQPELRWLRLGAAPAHH